MNLEFGKNLKKLRRERDMTQDELAQKLSLSVQAISRYETGTAYPDIEMLPVIAGFFGISIDSLLGVSRAAKEQRMEEYQIKLRGLTDRNERLALLRRQHAEFPEEWAVVSDMVYEMTYIPECIQEIRDIVNDAVKNCDDILWRENLIFFYLKSEPDESAAEEFIEKWCSRYDMTKIALLSHRYICRGDHEKQRGIRQKMIVDKLTEGLCGISERENCDAEQSMKNCQYVLDFISNISGSDSIQKPDMWVSTKLRCLLRLANNYFALSEIDEGFAALENAVCLIENLFRLPNGTVLTYGSTQFDRLSAAVEKQVYYNITENSGIVAHSMMMDLKYQIPIGFVNENSKYVRDMEGFNGMTVFSSQVYDVLNFANLDGFAKENVKNDPRYNELKQRAKAVYSLENVDNMMFLIDSHINRTDPYVKNMKWVCVLFVRDVGAYVVFDDQNDIREKFDRMQKEGNTLVYTAAFAEFGGEPKKLPETLRGKLLLLNEENRNAQYIMRESDGRIAFKNLFDLKR